MEGNGTGQKDKTLQTVPPSLYLLPSLIARNDLTLDLKPIILLHPFDVNIPKCSHRSQNPSSSDLLVREIVEVERECETGFGDYPSGPEVARLAVSLDDRLDFG